VKKEYIVCCARLSEKDLHTEGRQQPLSLNYTMTCKSYEILSDSKLGFDSSCCMFCNMESNSYSMERGKMIAP
jgi:hypothetical protein